MIEVANIKFSIIKHEILKKFYFFIFAILLFSTCLAKQIPIEDAKKAGIHFYYERINQYQSVPLNSLKIIESFTFKESNGPLYYIFNFEEKGYVIVSADNSITPILAYSFKGLYSEENPAPQFTAWMKQYYDQIHFIKDNPIPENRKTISEWYRLLSDDPADLKILKTRNVEPLIYSKWDQGSPYNGMCPPDALGPGGYTYAGCVPTCMGQIMYYYRWPDKGVGSYSDRDTTYGILHVNFDSTYYKWENMKNSITKNNHGIAELLYHLGVSCDLVYGPGGSGMYNHKAAYALKTFFKYSPNTQYIFRDSTSINWDSLIIAHLDRKMPLYYAGWSVPNINGHAFVCDGYQDSAYFHFNFGWSGSNDGYFYLNNLNPGGNNFNLAQELIINIYPDTTHYTYPKPCDGISTIKYTEGSLTDGSGPMKNYNSDSKCQWLIDPQTDYDSISSITLTFDQFTLNSNDSVIVYDGKNTEAPLLGVFVGASLPPAVTSTGNKMLLRFSVAPGNTAPGWIADFTTVTPVWCHGTTIINGDTADFSDGSYRFNYRDNSNCKWKLLASDTMPLTIYFKSFDSEPDKDVLKIYDLDSQALLATISGHYDSLDLPLPVTTSKGKIMMMFTTNSSVSGKGFEIYYPKSTIGLKENNIPGLSIYPNPARDKINIGFFLENKQEIAISLLSLKGEELYSDKRIIQGGHFLTTINTSDLSSGIYVLKINTQKTIIIRKILID